MILHSSASEHHWHFKMQDSLLVLIIEFYSFMAICSSVVFTYRVLIVGSANMEGNWYHRVGFLDIHALLIIYRIRNLNIHKLFIEFRVSNEYLLSTIIY